MSKWYKWDSLELFNAWHEQKIAELGLPKLSVDSDGVIIPNSFMTSSITIPVVLSDVDCRAIVEDENAEGLLLSTSPVERHEA
jgi:hypothetical protein